jgi:hypothetical protein
LRISCPETDEDGSVLKRLGVLLIWVLATIGTASLTYAAVTQADRAVGDNPTLPVAGADIAAQIPVTTTTAPTSSTTGAVITTTTIGVPTSGVTTTTLATSTTATSPPTTAGASTTTTVATASSPQWKTVPGVGTVGVAVSGSSVTLVSATPVAPYHIEVDDNGPEKVDVKFESETMEYRVRAEIIGGTLTWSVTNSADDD